MRQILRRLFQSWPPDFEPEHQLEAAPFADKQARAQAHGAARAEPLSLFGQPVILMTTIAFQDMMGFLTSRDPEAGGMLIGPKEHDLVTHFIPDEGAETTVASYTPTADWLNGILKKFLACGMDAKGMGHSHPAGCTHPSFGDLDHVRNTFARAKNAGAYRFLLPIVCGRHLYPYLLTREEPDRVQLAKVIVV